MFTYARKATWKPNNVGSCCVCVGSGVQTNATTPPTMLGVVASVRAVVCKRMQQHTDNVGSFCVRVGIGVLTDATTSNNVGPSIVGRIQPIRLWCPCVMRMRGPNNVGRKEELCKRIQHCCATLQRSRSKRNVGSCWFKSLTEFKLCATTPKHTNNIQQHAKRCANGRNM